MKYRLLGIVLYAGWIMSALSGCSKNEEPKRYVPITPSAQKLQLASVGYALQSEVNSPENKKLATALDTLSRYLSMPGLPFHPDSLLNVQAQMFRPGQKLIGIRSMIRELGEHFLLNAGGVYQFDQQSGSWLLTAADTCVRLSVQSGTGLQTLVLTYSGETQQIQLEGRSYRLPARFGMTFTQNGQELMSATVAFALPVGENAGLSCRMSAKTSELSGISELTYSGGAYASSFSISKAGSILIGSSLSYAPGDSLRISLNAKDRCFLYAALPDIQALEGSIQEEWRSQLSNGTPEESTCRAICDTVNKYLVAYLNFDQSDQKTVGVYLDYDYQVSMSTGAISFDFFPVLKFSDGSLNSLEDYISYQGVSSMWIQWNQLMDYLKPR